MDSLQTVSPILTSEQICNRELLYPPKVGDVRVQSWVSTLSRLQDYKIGIADLHPTVFASPPRLVPEYQQFDEHRKQVGQIYRDSHRML